MSQRSSMLVLGALVGAATAALAAPVSAQATGEKLTVHGYLSQGVAYSDSLPIHGIGTDAPTTNYRSAALQFRYAMTTNDALVIQLSHRRVGSSIMNEAQDEVSLDWGFYQRRFGATALKVGRVAMPRGIYNEIRDVGTVLPFYRAPYNFYSEGLESIDGVVVTHTKPIGRWTLEGSVYGGGIEFKQPVAGTEGQFILEDRAEKAVGGQLWVGTPLPGLRVGAGAQSFEMQQGLGSGQTEDATTWMASVDGTFDRFFVRAEVTNWSQPSLDYLGKYVQAGVKLTEQLSVNGQIDVADMEIPTPFGRIDLGLGRDRALSVNYAVSPSLVLKLEGHRTKGYNYDVAVGPAPGRTNYVIASVAASF